LVELSKRLQRIPPYLFAEMDKKIEERIKQGADVISFAVGDPDLSPPSHVVEALKEALSDPQVHRYPSYKGSREFREAVAAYYRARWGVELDPETQILALIGSKEGIAHLPMAVCSEGDVVLVPDPAYPVYEMSALIAGCDVYHVRLDADNGFLPDLESVPSHVLERARLLWINYPNNPTSAFAELSFFERVVDFANEHNLVVAHDNAYAEITFDGVSAPSILEVEGAADVAVEFLSLSKTFSLAGWRVGMVAGCEAVVGGLGQIKTNIDSGIFGAIQKAASVALTGPWDFVEEARRIYGRRARLIVDSLRKLWCPGLAYPKGTLYVWAPVPEGKDSGQFAEELLEKCDVVVVPGAGYGQGGEGYIRMSVTLDDERIEAGLARIGDYWDG
jgi:LL-diaminopimelate aminotransferase